MIVGCACPTSVFHHYETAFVDLPVALLAPKLQLFV
jgi:hypothetical protein